MIAISIIVPIYNTEKYLKRCFDSIINQTIKNVEIVLINDGSTDNSLKIIAEYAKNDSRIKIIDQANKGLSATRNIGIKAANGTYILHIDSDDWIELDMCEIMYREAEKHNADIVTSHVFFEYPNKTIVKYEPYKTVTNISGFLIDFATRRGLNSVCNKLIKRDLYMENNIEHYEDISLGEDSSALLRLIVFANTIVSVNKAFYHYDIKETSMTGSKNKAVMEYMYGLSKVERFYKENNIGIDIFPILRLKIAYINLYGNMQSSKDEYKELKDSFLREISAIIQHRLFSRLCFKYKCFIVFHFIFRKII